MHHARELLILRHAKSAWDTGAANDFDRPLAPRGKRDAPRMAGWIAGANLTPGLIVSSPARRADQTARAVAQELAIGEDAIEWDKRVYHGYVEELVEILGEYREEPQRMMLVGHNPGLEDLVEFLSGAAIPLPKRGKAFPTAALAHFRMPGDWSGLRRGAGRLVNLIRPRSLG